MVTVVVVVTLEVGRNAVRQQERQDRESWRRITAGRPSVPCPVGADDDRQVAWLCPDTASNAKERWGNCCSLSSKVMCWNCNKMSACVLVVFFVVESYFHRQAELHLKLGATNKQSVIKYVLKSIR